MFVVMIFKLGVMRYIKNNGIISLVLEFKLVMNIDEWIAQVRSLHFISDLRDQ